jgi:hypothetical protein
MSVPGHGSPLAAAVEVKHIGLHTCAANRESW